MKLIRFTFLTFSILCIAVSTSFAARVYISDVAPGDGTPDPQATPVIEVNEGETTNLYLWAVSDGGLQIFSGFGLDIAANGAGSASMTGAGDIPSPLNNFTFQPRWSSSSLGAGGGGLLVQNFNTTCFGACTGLGGGLGQNGDPTYDAASSSFPLATITIQGDAAGLIDLQLQVGSAGITDNTGPVSLHFGSDAGGLVNGGDFGGGASDGTVHAQINVIGTGGDPDGIVLDGGANGDDFPIRARDGSGCGPNGDCTASPGGAPVGRLVLSPNEFVVDSFFDVFFDISCDAGDDSCLGPIADNLGSSGQDGVAGVSGHVEDSPFGNLRVRIDESSGDGMTVAFDFAAQGGQVNTVTIPEPSTVVLALLSLVGLVAIRRRKK